MIYRLLCIAIFAASCFAPEGLLAQGKGIKISGKVVEGQSGQAIPYATVAVMHSRNGQLLTGTTTQEDGTFTLTAKTDSFYVEVSFMGFATRKVTDIAIASGKADLGEIPLQEDNQTLDEVVVRAEKSQTVFKLDKRVFNVGQDLSSTGASALEVLNNVPSVNVNIEGEISLRGSAGVQVLINGKPSVLAEEGNALGTITADMIDKIEVITNPSAKHDAEGTSGIINIIIKKEERKGTNGSISLNTGYPHNHSIGLSLNRRTEKFNLFSQLGTGYRELPRTNENINQDFLSGTKIESDGKSYRNEYFFNIILGTDYHINRYNVLTLSGNFAYEIEQQPSETNFREWTNIDSLPSAIWQRTEETEATNPKWRYELQYKKEFKDNEDHSFLFSALGNFFGKDQSSDFENTATLGTLESALQKTETNFSEANYTFQSDYTKPFAEKWKLEAGAQYVMQDVSNDYTVSDLDAGIWVVDASLTNIFEYDQKVLGVYATQAYEGDKWGVKLGLRLENTNLQTLLANTDEENTQKYTDLFPSGHLSYKITENVSLQAGYSKRIFRPRLWDLNPFFNISNNFVIRTGNPELQPEYTDSYEVGGIYTFEKFSLNTSVYHRRTNDVIERVSNFENNVSTYKPVNVGTKRSTGVELNAKYSPTKWMTLNADANFNYFIRKGTFEGVSFDFDANQWSTKVTAKFKLPADFDLEATGQYESKFKTVQGVFNDNIYADLGLRKKILKGKMVVNASVRDIFASSRHLIEIENDDFYIYNSGKRGRFVTLGISYGFGKGEAMQYSGGRRH